MARVLHPALPDCPATSCGRAISPARRGCSRFVLAGGDDAARTALIDGLRHFGIGFSWGGFESLALPVDPRRCAPRRAGRPKGRSCGSTSAWRIPADLIADLAAGSTASRGAGLIA